MINFKSIPVIVKNSMRAIGKESKSSYFTSFKKSLI